MALFELTLANFDETVDKNELLFIDFAASWCAPCKVFTDVFKQAQEKNPDILFATVDVDKEIKLAQEFNIQSVPHLIVMKKKVVIYSDSGAKPLSVLNELIEQARAAELEEDR